MNKNIGVIASRLKCIDSVSIEAEKWVDKYSRLGYNLHLIAGKFGEPVEIASFELPELDYKHPEVRGVKRILFSSNLDKAGIKAANILMNSLVKRIKKPLKNYLIKNKIDIIHVEDALATLKNVPLTIALTQIIKELKIPALSRYHYFYWDNPYFTKFNNIPQVMLATPPKANNIVHITNSNFDKDRLNEKKKIISTVIPNVIDTDKLRDVDEYNADFRKDLGIADDVLIFLQPTRVKRNKCIEKSIKLVSEINDLTKKDNVLLITGAPVYNRGNYFEEMVKKAKKQKVNIMFADDRVFISRHQNKDMKFYSIGDAYIHADFVLYPNMGEAFGTPLLEAAAYRKPVVVNQYPNLKEILENDFKFVVLDQKITKEVISDVYELLMDMNKRAEMVEHNLEVLKKHYSIDMLEDKLIPVLNQFEQEGFIKRMANKIIPQRFKKHEKAQKTAGKRRRNP